VKVKAFSDLLEIWRLIDKDPSSKTIMLTRRGAYVGGMHIGASRKCSLDIGKPILLDGANLTGAVKLLPPLAKVDMKQTDASLILNAGKRRAVLRMNISSPLPDDIKITSPEFDCKRLRNAIPFLRSCTSGGVLQPILTGIRFSKGKKKGEVVLEATDKEMRSGRLSLKLLLKAAGQVVPAADLEQALSLMEGRVSMRFDRGHLLMKDATTKIKIALLQGAYPDLSRLPQPKSYKHRMALHKAPLDTAVKAAILLDSDRLVTLSIKDGTAAWMVHGQETGGFRQPIGPTKLPDIEIVFDAHWLDSAQYVGAEFVLKYNDERTPVLFSGNKRFLWMSPVAK